MIRLLIILASLPGILLIVYVYKQDKIEKEPKGLLLKLMLFGVLSIIPAVIAEVIGALILGLIFPEGGVLYAIIDCFFVVAFAEEGFKFLMLKAGSWKSREFNYSFDGVVYAVSTGLGFAIVENILYVIDSGVSLAFMRAFTAVVAHAVFGVIMGIFYGKARQFETLCDVKRKKLYFRRAVLYPVLVHGLYDYLLSVGSILAGVAFVVVLIVLYVVMFAGVKNAAKKDAPTVPWPTNRW